MSEMITASAEGGVSNVQPAATTLNPETDALDLTLQPNSSQNPTAVDNGELVGPVDNTDHKPQADATEASTVKSMLTKEQQDMCDPDSVLQSVTRSAFLRLMNSPGIPGSRSN
jgi:hypothetical protein